jgi:hypothetical protein
MREPQLAQVRITSPGLAPDLLWTDTNAPTTERESDICLEVAVIGETISIACSLLLPVPVLASRPWG